MAWPKERKISKFGRKRSVINLYAPKNIGFKYITQKLAELKGKKRKSIITVGDLNALLWVMDRGAVKTSEDKHV